MSKQKIHTEDFMTFSNVGIPDKGTNKKERNLSEELHKKNWQTQTIDNFEKALGVTPVQKKNKLKYKTRVFSPDYEKDAALMNELMNHPKYAVVYWKDTWTVEGLYKAFVIYSENLDYIEPEQKIEKIANGEE
jgi:hypothetical protein